MGAYAVPLLIAVASITLTYVFCLRPMRRDACAASWACSATNSRAETADEIAALSREIDALRQSMADPEDEVTSRAIRQADIPN